MCYGDKKNDIYNLRRGGVFILNILINRKEYQYISNSIKNEEFRESYFNLAHKVFGVNFRPWYQSGFCSESFIPYTLYTNGIAVSSVGVVLNNFKWGGKLKRYAQISTVMTESSHRMQGLGRWLLETVIEEWKKKCDAVYLYANDSVVDFYPMFGFMPVDEYRYSLSVTKRNGDFRKLDLSIQNDVDLLVKKHKESNRLSLLSMQDDVEIMMFHCITFLRDYIYYIEEYDAIVIAKQDGHEIFCYDIYSDGLNSISSMLSTIASTDSCTAMLGFTPKEASAYTVEKANEGNTTLFVLNGMENILTENKITLPFLSRA